MLKKTFHGFKRAVSIVPVSALLSISEAYHRARTQTYWSNTTVTHGDMSNKQFDFYVHELIKLIGEQDIGQRLLDYGGGNGEIAEILQASGFSVDVAEFSINFKKNIESKRLKFVSAEQLPIESYDIIIANNCIFYTHPNKLNAEISRLMRSLRSGGVLWITDTPTKEKINRLTANKFLRTLFRVTGVYQSDLGGFFVDSQALSKQFNAKIFDSWTPYRSHFKIVKSWN